MKTMLAELKRLFNRDSIYKNVSAHNQYLYLRFHRKGKYCFLLFRSRLKQHQHWVLKRKSTCVEQRGKLFLYKWKLTMRLARVTMTILSLCRKSALYQFILDPIWPLLFSQVLFSIEGIIPAKFRIAKRNYCNDELARIVSSSYQT